MITTLKLVVSYDVLGLEKLFKELVLVIHFSKICQYATKDEKVCKSLKYVFVKVVQLDLQKCIILPKNLGKGQAKME
jgi:hypothetical protein